MLDSNLHSYLKNLISNVPEDWVKLTTHRLDIYHEDLAKTEFLDGLENLFQKGDSSTKSLAALPTAYDYIRLGHPLSSVLEWALAKNLNLAAKQVISFDSVTMPILALLRTNALLGKATQIYYLGEMPPNFDQAVIESVYDYSCSLQSINSIDEISDFKGSTLLVSKNADLNGLERNSKVDFQLSIQGDRGSVMVVDGPDTDDYVAAIQHVRRRETVAMTPANCLHALELWLNGMIAEPVNNALENLASTQASIQVITGSPTPALVASSGLSMQYAIMMGLIDEAREKHPQQEIKIIVPPNCYGGTNDQARRVAASLQGVSIMDLPVDGDNDMVQSTDQVLKACAEIDAVPLIIAEIPTNPRVEVPNLDDLRAVLSAKRNTPESGEAVAPIFILDQTFCPNVQFLKSNGILSSIRTISYVSGSKFPSGGKCTAGYCVANEEAADLMTKIGKHLVLCDNAATPLQLEILAAQMPSMNDRIAKAYRNTRDFVNFIEETLPTAKINFVSEELAQQEFTPSVFSLDLPTKGDSPEERESYKRELNLKLINRMIGEIPNESKYCVSYGQLKGCYWTIPATSTQGTTKEADKDYIARVSVSPDLDLEKHKAVFKAFVEEEI